MDEANQKLLFIYFIINYIIWKERWRGWMHYTKKPDSYYPYYLIYEFFILEYFVICINEGACIQPVSKINS